MDKIDAMLEDYRSRIREQKGRWRGLAAASGGAFSFAWLGKFHAGETNNPRIRTLFALDCALRKLERNGEGK